MKKAIATLLALVMALLLAACGGGGTPADTAAPGETAENTSANPETPAASEPAEEPASETQEDLVTVEAVSLTPLTKQTGVKVKIRNLSDEMQDYITVTIKALDKNGDILASLYASVKYLEAGVAENTGHFHLDCHYEDINALRMSTYSISKSRGNGTFGEDHKEYMLNHPITFVFSEETEPDESSSTTGKSYLWLPESAAAEHQEAAASLYGTWEVTEITVSSGVLTVKEMEESGVYTWSEWMVVVSDTGKIYIQTNNTSMINDCTVDGSGIAAGSGKFRYENNQLVFMAGSTRVCYDKVSGSQEFPSVEKSELVELLKGTWELESASRSGSFTFTDKTARATINNVVFEADTVCILMRENRVIISAQVSGNLASMNLDYIFDNSSNSLALKYDGDTLVKQAA